MWPRCRIQERSMGDRKLNISARSYFAWSFFSCFSPTAEVDCSCRPSWSFGSDISLLGLQLNYNSFTSSLQNVKVWPFQRYQTFCQLYSNCTYRGITPNDGSIACLFYSSNVDFWEAEQLIIIRENNKAKSIITGAVLMLVISSYAWTFIT